MTFVVYRSQASASLRRIPLWLVTSDGTTPAGAEAGGQPQIHWVPRGTVTIDTSGTLSLVSANAGEYYVELIASEVSALGAAKIHYRSGNAIANSTPFEIVNYDSGDSVRLGVFALPDAVAEAAGGLYTRGTGAGQINQQTDGQVDVNAERLRNAVLNALISGRVDGDIGAISADATAAINLEAAFDGTGYDSNLTTFVKDSIATIAGVTNTATLIAALNDIDGSNVTLHAGTHSDVTIQGLSSYANISDVTLHAGIHSDVTITGLQRVGPAAIIATSYGVGARDAAGQATDVGEENADRWLARDLAGGSDSAADGRSNRNALRMLRNRVDASSSVLTIFQENDTTSAWTASITTSGDPGHINEINPL